MEQLQAAELGGTVGQEPSVLDVRVFGPCEIATRCGTTPVTAPALRALLLRLLVEPNRDTPVSELARAVYGDALPASYRRTMQVQLSRLRGIVGIDRLVHHDDAYRLVVSSAETDVGRFDELVEAGREAQRAGDEEVAVSLLRRALDLIRGEPAGLNVRSGLVVQDAHRLVERSHAAHEDLIDAELALGRHRDLADRLYAFVARHPLRSRSVGQLMLALHRAGRSADAVRAYQDHRAYLAEEMGLDPSAELSATELAVLANAPEIEWRPVAPAQIIGPAHDASPYALPRAMHSDAAPFVGRLAEQAKLAHAWESARNGAGCVVAIGGEAGIGKSRLVAELCAKVSSTALVVFGRCEPEVALPYRPFLEAVCSAFRQIEGHELRALVEGIGSRLVRVIPELSTRMPDLVPEPENDPALDEFWLYEAVAVFLRRLSQRHPVVLVLDDMQWADRSTARLLRHVERMVPTTRLLVLVTYRTSDAADVHALNDLIGTAGAPGHIVLKLEGLDEHDVRSLAQRVAPRRQDDAPALRLRTGGNPFFLHELLRDQDDAGDSATLPPGITAVVRNRLECLGPGAERVLSAAAVVGPVFRIDVLCQMLDMSDEIVDVIDAGLRTGLLVAASEEGSYAFSHALVIEVLLGDLSDARSRQLHARAAQVLASAHNRDSGFRLAEVARHYVAAAPLGYVDEAIGFSRRAARQAAELSAFDESVKHLERAIHLDDASPFGARHRAALRLELGEMQTRAGTIDGARTPTRSNGVLHAAVLVATRKSDAHGSVALERHAQHVASRCTEIA